MSLEKAAEWLWELTVGEREGNIFLSWYDLKPSERAYWRRRAKELKAVIEEGEVRK